MDSYNIEGLAENAFKALLGATVNDVPVSGGISANSLEKSHVYVFAESFSRAEAINFSWDGEVIVGVVTWMDEADPTAIEALHQLRLATVRNALWQDNLAAQLTGATFICNGVVIGGFETVIEDRSVLTRHHFMLREVGGLE